MSFYLYGIGGLERGEMGVKLGGRSVILRVSGNKKIFYVAISDGVVLKKESFYSGY